MAKEVVMLPVHHPMVGNAGNPQRKLWNYPGDLSLLIGFMAEQGTDDQGPVSSALASLMLIPLKS